LRIEVETRSIEDVKKVCAIGRGKVFRIMVDNFTPQQITEHYSLLKMILKLKPAEASTWIIFNLMLQPALIM
jgi:nicotinate-nucleotide pyrophosphorylase